VRFGILTKVLLKLYMLKVVNNTTDNPLVRQIGDYTIADLQLQYKKYIHKLTKYLLL